MNVEYLIQLLNNKLIVLKNAKILSYNNGDLSSINSLDEEILGVENTLSQLKLLLTIDTAAASTNLTSTEIVASGIESIQNTKEEPTTQGPSASAIVNNYDISAYATDPLHEQKIQSIVDSMPPVNVDLEIDNYIQQITPGSPITGQMVMNAANQYTVNIPLLLAIMQNDSSFGTAGIGARTFNPGNVGNTGYAEQSFPSWQDGVNAVAEWLDKHRVLTIQ